FSCAVTPLTLRRVAILEPRTTAIDCAILRTFQRRSPSVDAGGRMSAIPDLIEMLSLRDSEARTHYDIFTGPALATPHGRSFGGQVLGQALAAAGETVSEDRALHSMHGYFLRPGD